MPVLTRSAARFLVLQSLVGNDEILAHITSFLPCEEDNAVMKMCLAVGTEGARIIRHTYLHSNFTFLLRVLSDFIDGRLSNSQCKECFLDWMTVNADWRRYCTDDLIKKCELVSFEGEDEDKIRYRYSAAAIFNNPAVAIEFGLLDVIRYLIEDKGIDVNSCVWNRFKVRRRTHLLVVAMLQEDMSCYQYLLTVENINIGSMYNDRSVVSVINYASTLDNEFTETSEDEELRPIFTLSPEHFEALVGHPSFDLLEGGRALIFASQSFATCGEESPMRTEKINILMRAGVDPNRLVSLEDGDSTMISPIVYVKTALRKLVEDSGMGRLYYNSMTGKILKEIVVAMEEWGPSSSETDE